ncbi:MAG: hypothetical protein LBG24_05720, partial [Treponema sp.]|nr:hypothetical protein [Treponema sp.]
VFSPTAIWFMNDIMAQFEGKTEKSKHPYPEGNLAWAVGRIARLGGWTGFAGQRPPGTITLYEGWVRFFNLFDGWAIAKNVYKRWPLRLRRRIGTGRKTRCFRQVPGIMPRQPGKGWGFPQTGRSESLGALRRGLTLGP